MVKSAALSQSSFSNFLVRSTIGYSVFIILRENVFFHENKSHKKLEETMTWRSATVEQQRQKLYSTSQKLGNEIKFEDFHVLLSERKQEIPPLILSKHGLSEDKTVCRECHDVAREIQKDVLVCNWED